jgi:hypothetical protein
MPDDAIKRALEVAAEAVRLRARFSPHTGMALSEDFAAAAIAAFLRALPKRSTWGADREELAAAIERAAGGGA